MVESSPSLTAKTALRIVGETEAEFGWSSRGAQILGPVGENASVHLPGQGLVVRICAREQRQRAARELSLARWLCERDLPATRVSEGFSTPLLHQGWVITAWQYIPGIEPGTPQSIGGLLRRLHRLEAPPGFPLPVLDPFEGITGYIEQSALARRDRDFLNARLDELQEAYTRLRFVLPLGPVHGDAHRKNIARDHNGDPVMLDLERFSVGPREWDLVVAAVYERVGWYTSAEYGKFAHAYGWDVRTWSGFQVLAAARELRMTAWLCARTGREPRLLTEARRRIASLRRPEAPKHWRPGT